GSLHLLHPGGAKHLGALARRYGPLLRVTAGGREVLVLSSVGTIREALAGHWGDWLGRPPSYLGSLVSRGGRDLALGAPTPGWRRQRAATRGALARAGGRLRTILRLQAERLVEELRSYGGAPLDPFGVFAFHTCSTIGHLLFGDLVGIPHGVRGSLWVKGVSGGPYGVAVFQVLPNPGLQRLLRLVELRDAFVETQIRRHEVGDRLGSGGFGEESPSPPGDTVLAALLGRDPAASGGPLSAPRLHMALVDLFIGGTETTAAALAWAVAFLLHRPELQERLREELRRELGPGGTPEPGDTKRLPLLQATVTETLRLRPPAPLALPHCARRDTSVGGIPVPAGSILLPNILAAHQDPKIWPRPQEFLPERFLSPGAPCRSLLPFGCGARACPGEGLARAELLVFLGHLLLHFRLEAPPPPLDGSAGTVLRPRPFRLRMAPASP
ncbi:CP21A hydroxylase, partial [Rhinopomastus cyanomelas]|nr:CP21A hydroxylase [Rhinopomastus cyanomelas]